MKKLMTAAAVAALTAGAFAVSYDPIDCEDPITPSVELCDYMVFKVTGSGKTVADKGSYKKVESLKIKKGALLFKYNECCAEENGVCCYDLANLYATVKIGKETVALAVSDIAVDKWSIFGKDLTKALNWATQIKTGKKVTLESDLLLVTDGGVVPGSDPQADFIWGDKDDFLWADKISFAASAFGKYQVKVNKATEKAKSGYCVVTTNSTACAATWTPKTYNGWFVGTRTLLDANQACFNCECGIFDVFGGTWKAVYQAKKSTNADAQKIAFGTTLLTGLVFDDWAEGVEEDEE